MPKRILIFSLAYQPFVGGAEVAVKEITDRLSDYEFEMITANLDGQQEKIERVGNILVRRVANKYLFPFAAYRLAVKRQRQCPYDAIWAIMANQAGMAAALFKRCFPRVPLLLTLQEGDDLESLTYRLRLLAPRWFGVFRRADEVQAISNYLARFARRMGAKCPIDVVPNGVDVGRFEVRGEKLDRKEKVIITTSRLVKKNGVDVLIEAMRYLPNDMGLLIVGSGPEEISLKQLMLRLNLDNRVEFFGQVPPDQVAGYLTQADVFARPSRSEGLGNSFLEAMAAGVPIVGTAVGGIPDFLYDPQWQGESLPISKDSPLRLDQTGLPRRQTGWVCEVNNPKNLVEKVKYILDPINSDKVKIVTRNARELIIQKYDWTIISQKMAQIIDNLLGVDK